MIIAVDFDCTICEHAYPDIGDPVPGAFAWLKLFQKAGAKLILWTMRSDVRNEAESPLGNKANRDYLSEAVAFCGGNGLSFWGVNENPEQASWTDSPKVFAHLYIDDAAAGCPLLKWIATPRPMVDWSMVGPMVFEMMEMERIEQAAAP